ncbi:MAG TPA: tail fiber domain-containing protein [Thermoanaerobaculia bacterium]|nr:tail fiber domain-containing protein [Thermoanaerobaculia bacterium]
MNRSYFAVALAVALALPAVAFARGAAGGSDSAGASLAAAGEAAGNCTPTATTMCLQNGSFEVSATFMTANGLSGQAQAVALTDDTGYFWFFSSANVEVVLKVLDGCGLNGHFWVFAGGLTNVQVDVTVRRLVTGIMKHYVNTLNIPYQPVQDTSAFACTIISTARAKKDVRDMGDASDPLMKMRPVTFYYRPEFDDGSHLLQYGLIAEEVAKLYPGMVQFDREGKPQALRYHLLNSMLLNEVQKQRREAERQQQEIAALRLQVDSLRQQIEALATARTPQ